MTVPEISVQELEALRKAGAEFLLLDVRNADEYAAANLGGLLIPLADLPTRVGELKPDQHIVIHCHGGGRSRRATEYLLQQGFSHVSNLKGGISAWINEIGPARGKSDLE